MLWYALLKLIGTVSQVSHVASGLRALRNQRHAKKTHKWIVKVLKCSPPEEMRKQVCWHVLDLMLKESDNVNASGAKSYVFLQFSWPFCRVIWLLRPRPSYSQLCKIYNVNWLHLINDFPLYIHIMCQNISFITFYVTHLIEFWANETGDIFWLPAAI